MELHIKLAPKKLLKLFGGLSFLLIFLNLVNIFCRFYLHISQRLIWIFDVSGDNNIPTWYSSITLLLCSLLLIFIGLLKVEKGERYSSKWLGLGAIFVLLSIDEVAKIHESSANLIKVPVVNGFLYYNWVIFGIMFVFLVGLYYLNFVRKLPVEIRNLFLLSATLFIGGALGVEMINSKLHYLQDSGTISYAIGTAIEELFEMLGVATFIFSLLTYIKKYMGIEALQVICLSRSSV